MGKKIFVSYKYADSNVKNLNYYLNSTVRNYVDYLENLLGRNNIYKGEHDGEDLSKFTEEWTWTTLKEKIFDSSVTIVLISPNMKIYNMDETNQWIPQEIAYSLKEIAHNGYYSRTNALLYVVLPDSCGNYDYYITHNYLNNTITYNTSVIFEIMSKNIFNKNPKYGNGSYAVTVKWDDFVKDHSRYINKAVEHQNNIEQYIITKGIKKQQWTW